MRINTYKHKFGCHITLGLQQENDFMYVEYDGSKIELGPQYAIKITGNMKGAAFGFALLMADNIEITNHSNILICKFFEINKEIGIVKSFLETNDQINEFIFAFNKVWPSVLLLE